MAFPFIQACRCVALLSMVMSLAAAQDPVERPRFVSAIRAFLAQDSVQAPPKQAIEFIGSSIFRQWTSVSEDMKPLPVFNRAFGGSRTLDLLDHMDAVVLPYEPCIIVYYCGSNDVNGNVPADSVVARVEQFVARVHRRLPVTKIFFVSVNKAPQKRKKWATVDSINSRVHASTVRDVRRGYIDVNATLLNSEGEPLEGFFRSDSLHLTPSAYEALTRVIKPVLIRAWSPE